MFTVVHGMYNHSLFQLTIRWIGLYHFGICILKPKYKIHHVIPIIGPLTGCFRGFEICTSLCRVETFVKKEMQSLTLCQDMIQRLHCEVLNYSMAKETINYLHRPEQKFCTPIRVYDSSIVSNCFKLEYGMARGKMETMPQEMPKTSENKKINRSLLLERTGEKRKKIYLSVSDQRC